MSDRSSEPRIGAWRQRLGGVNGWRAGGLKRSDGDNVNRPICRYFQNGSCRNGRNCRFDHPSGQSQDNPRQFTPQETLDQQRARADYNKWKRYIRSPPVSTGERTVEQLWDDALTILNGEEREWKQMLPRDLVDDDYHGLEHIKLLLTMRPSSEAVYSYLQLVQPFLLVITHPSLLDCLSVDTFVGALYTFIGGTSGTRAIPFLQSVCETLVTAFIDATHLTTSAMVSTILIATSTVLLELLRREPRARFNDDAPTLLDTTKNALQIIGRNVDSQAQTVVLNCIAESRAIVARAKGLLVSDEDQQSNIGAAALTSAYPRTLQAVPQNRYDNDKKDITEIKIFPTREEILSEDEIFLPSTDLDQPHFLLDQAERHIDTQFRLLRHDIFGELRDVLGSSMHAVEKDPNNPNLEFHGFRAHRYSDAYISHISFDSRQGLRMDLSFAQPLAAYKKTASERRKWWEESRRLTEGVLLSFISFHAGEIQNLFFIVTKKNIDAKKNPNVVTSTKQGTITAALATFDQVNMESAVQLGYQKSHGLLIEFPGVLPATFMPILENLQDMQRQSRLPFRQWILPDRIDSVQQVTMIEIPPPLYARKPGFMFSLEPLLKPNETHDETIKIDPFSSKADLNIVNEMEAHTSLDRGQCQALLAALTREFAFIQGPPGTGKSYLGVQMMKVLMHHKETADLGPVVIVCYTNHALDQFLEHLLDIGIKKVIRIGGSSKSSRLEAHNLREISPSERKTRSESYLLATHFQSLAKEADCIKINLGKIHGLRTQDKWSSLEQYLSHNHHHIYAQFTHIDKDGFTTVGQNAFDLWAPASTLSIGTKRNDRGKLTANDVEDILFRADTNVHALSQPERRLLVRFWCQKVWDHALDDLYDSVKKTESIKQQMANIYDETNRRVLQNADVIGLTTTGLAKHVSVLKRVRCKIVICEEAGEVMEPHMISALLPTVEHFIQIGDHEQLRPQINNFLALSLESKQGALYQLDRSQFERLSVGTTGRPKMPVAQLSVQRRMRPEISTLVRETIYPSLNDHASTKNLPDVLGMRNSVFWLDHKHLEDNQHPDAQQYKSHANTWEVEMVHALVRHIVRQGTYSSSEIAVLTPYTGQLQRLRSIMRNDFEIVLSDRDQDALERDGFDTNATHSGTTASQAHRGQPKKIHLEKKQLSDLLRVATVDNFQGEEAKVVIVSLVRSNNASKVGFLRTTNRINVLLSRAQHGMYLIGNADTYSNIPMWQKVINMLRVSNSIGHALQLCCPRHKDTPIQVSVPDDFLRFSPEGGCNLPCAWRLPDCGHMCKSRCHSKGMHDVFQCPQPCQRLHDPCEHPCQKQTCGEDCGNCCVKLKDIPLPCGHVKDEVLCYIAQIPADIYCAAEVSKVVPSCGHAIEVACSVDTTADHFRCPVPCEKVLPCGHTCSGTCGQCTGEAEYMESHQKCQKPCKRPFGSCNHICRRPCHDGKDCGLCYSPCEVRCQHSKCMLLCYQTCDPCIETCTWTCEHQKSCTMPCSAPCNRLPCDERCSKTLPCGHQCPGLCGEICPADYCHQCANKQDARVDLLEMKTYAEIDVGETPVVLLGCGHFFTAETLDGMIGLQDVYTANQSGQFEGLTDISGALATKIPQCPDCQRPVRQYVTQRYNRVINKAVIDEMSKRFLTEGQSELSDLERQVDEFEETLEITRSDTTSTVGRPLIGAHSRRRTLTTVTTPADNRSKMYGQLIQQTKTFLRKFGKRQQPAQKLYEAQIFAARASRPDTLDAHLASLSIQEVIPAKGDQRVILGGRMVQTRTESIALEDAFVSKIGIPSNRDLELHKTTDLFFKRCIILIDDCNDANLPRLSVEATLCFAKVARLRQSSTKTTIMTTTTAVTPTESDDDKLAEHIDMARTLLEAAAQLCTRQFHNAEQLKAVVEQSLLSFKKPWYEPVTRDEITLIKQAMLEGRGGIRTHTGHWYQCCNGHPFAIGECGMPMEQARCPECGAAVGGSNHRAVEGVTRAVDMEN